MMLFRKLYQHTYQQSPLTTMMLKPNINPLSFMMMTNPALRMFSGGNIRPNITVSTMHSGFNSRSI